MVSMVALSVTWFFSEVMLRVVKFLFDHYPKTQHLLEALVGEITKMSSDLTGFSFSLAFIDRFLFLVTKLTSKAIFQTFIAVLTRY
jgi:hypothetical protein